MEVWLGRITLTFSQTFILLLVWLKCVYSFGLMLRR